MRAQSASGLKEPDFLLYSFYPISGRLLWRKLVRDIVGVSAWRIIKPRFTGLVKLKHAPLSLRFFVGQAIVFGLFWLAIHGCTCCCGCCRGSPGTNSSTACGP